MLVDPTSAVKKETASAVPFRGFRPAFFDRPEGKMAGKKSSILLRNKISARHDHFACRWRNA
jgi:hypothetical protein